MTDLGGNWKQATAVSAISRKHTTECLCAELMENNIRLSMWHISIFSKLRMTVALIT